jgi:hypothetical protein
VKKLGAGQTNNATSGSLPSAGYAARDQEKKARSQAIQNILPKGNADPERERRQVTLPGRG